MDESTREYRRDQLGRLGKDDGYGYKIKITGGTGEREPNWLNITPAELEAIRAVLLGEQVVYLVERENFDGLHVFTDEAHRDAYEAFLVDQGQEAYISTGSAPVISDDATFAAFMANERAEWDEGDQA